MPLPALPPEDSVSTNFTTWAYSFFKVMKYYHNLHKNKTALSGGFVVLYCNLFWGFLGDRFHCRR